MEKKERKFEKYIYFLISIVLLILITAEVSQIETYHSNSGTLNVDVTDSVSHPNQTDLIVIAKLPGVSVNLIMYLQYSLPPPYEYITAKVPANNSVASLSLDGFNSSGGSPFITVKFNSTSSVMNTILFSLGSNTNTTLTSSSPVSIMAVPASQLQDHFPAIVKTPQYDYLIIQVNNTATLQYAEVSR